MSSARSAAWLVAESSEKPCRTITASSARHSRYWKTVSASPAIRSRTGSRVPGRLASRLGDRGQQKFFGGSLLGEVEDATVAAVEYLGGGHGQQGQRVSLIGGVHAVQQRVQRGKCESRDLSYDDHRLDSLDGVVGACRHELVDKSDHIREALPVIVERDQPTVDELLLELAEIGDHRSVIVQVVHDQQIDRRCYRDLAGVLAVMVDNGIQTGGFQM